MALNGNSIPTLSELAERVYKEEKKTIPTLSNLAESEYKEEKKNIPPLSEPFKVESHATHHPMIAHIAELEQLMRKEQNALKNCRENEQGLQCKVRQLHWELRRKAEMLGVYEAVVIEKVSKLEDDLKKTKDKESSDKVKVVMMEQQLEESKLKLKQKIQIIHILNEKNHQLTTELKETKDKLNDRGKKLTYLQKQIKSREPVEKLLRHNLDHAHQTVCDLKHKLEENNKGHGKRTKMVSEGSQTDYSSDLDNINHLNKELKEQQAYSSKMLQERDNKIDELQAQIKQLHKDHQMENLSKWEEMNKMKKKCEHRRSLMDKEMKIMRSKLEAITAERDKALALIEQNKQKHAQKMTDMDNKNNELLKCKEEKIVALLKRNNQLREELQSEQKRYSDLEDYLHRANESTKHMEEVELELKRLKIQWTSTTRNNVNLEDKVKNLKFRLKSKESVLMEKEYRSCLLEYKCRDILANLEGCKEVLEDPSILKKKVAAMIGHYIGGHDKLQIDRDVENMLTEQLYLAEKANQRCMRLVQLHRREKKHLERVIKRKLKKENMLIRYINEHREKMAKSKDKPLHLPPAATTNKALTKTLTTTEPVSVNVA